MNLLHEAQKIAEKWRVEHETLLTGQNGITPLWPPTKATTRSKDYAVVFMLLADDGESNLLVGAAQPDERGAVMIQQMHAEGYSDFTVRVAT